MSANKPFTKLLTLSARVPAKFAPPIPSFTKLPVVSKKIACFSISSLLCSLNSNSLFTVELVLGKSILKFNAGCKISPDKSTKTSTGIFLLKEGLSSSTEGFAKVAYFALILNLALSGAPSQLMFPPGITAIFF